MVASIILPSFAGGELSPTLYARVDLEKFHVGAAQLRNWYVDYTGGVSTRPGTQFIARTKTPDAGAVRLIPFIVSTEAAYALEFGDQYIRFYQNGAAVTESSTAITNISKSNPATVTDPGHGYSNGDEIYISGVAGMTQVNGKNFLVSAAAANTFVLQTLDGVPVDSSGYTAYSSGGTAERIYTLASPYLASELALIKFVQSADVLTLCHPAHAPANLSRLTPSTFALTTIVFGSTIGKPTISSVTTSNVVAPPAWNFGYVVTAVTDDDEESLPSVEGIVNSGLLDNTQDKVVTITWGAVTGAQHYNIYKWGPVGGIRPHDTFFGYIGQTTALSFVDTNLSQDYSKEPPQNKNPFSGANPEVVTYYAQRKVYGAPQGKPENLEMSQAGFYNNFDTTPVSLATDAISISLASRQVNVIKSMVPVSGGLVVFTTGGAVLVNGGSPGAAVTPSSISADPQASTGANDIPPLLINYDILFVQNKGSTVRDLAFNFNIQSYYGADRSTLANHLFKGYTLLEWAYAEEPAKIVWVVRNDGVLLSLTYVPEQEVYGWAKHDTNGLFQSVCSIPEGNEDATYFVVERFGKKFIERLASRNFTTLDGAWCVDAGLAYSGAPVSEVSGLDYLAGQTVAIVADGRVLPEQVVSAAGTVTLDAPSEVVKVGLGYECEFTSLYLDTGEPTIQAKRKLITSVTMRVVQTRGLQAKGSAETVYYEVKGPSPIFVPPQELYSGDLFLNVANDWTQQGQMYVKQSYPLPATLLGLIPEFRVGDNAR